MSSCRCLVDIAVTTVNSLIDLLLNANSHPHLICRSQVKMRSAVSLKSKQIIERTSLIYRSLCVCQSILLYILDAYMFAEQYSIDKYPLLNFNHI